MTFESFNLLIDSSQRINQSESNTNFTVNLSRSYNVKIARCKLANIPLTQYNITNANNTLQWVQYDTILLSNTFYSLEIENGRYSTNSFIDKVNSTITTLGLGNMVLNFNSNSGRFVFSMNLPHLEVQLTPTPIIITLGFPYSTEPYPVYRGVTLTSIVIPTAFINTDYLKLTIKYLNGSFVNINNNQNSSSFLLEIKDDDYQNTFFGKTVFIENIGIDNGGKSIVFDNPVKLQSFTVSLTDKDDNVLDLNGVDWWCNIELITINSPTQPVQDITNTHLDPLYKSLPTYLINNCTC